jgi:hypothetical protein
MCNVITPARPSGPTVRRVSIMTCCGPAHHAVQCCSATFTLPIFTWNIRGKFYTIRVTSRQYTHAREDTNTDYCFCGNQMYIPTTLITITHKMHVWSRLASNCSTLYSKNATLLFNFAHHASSLITKSVTEKLLSSSRRCALQGGGVL